MNPIRLLVADDHQTFLDIATRYLQQQEGLVVAGTATGGLQLMRLAHQLRPQVVLVDLAMPDLSGLNAIRRIRTELPEIGIVALTILDTAEYRQASLEAGADEFVPKARLTDELPLAIRRAARPRAASFGPLGNLDDAAEATLAAIAISREDRL